MAYNTRVKLCTTEQLENIIMQDGELYLNIETGKLFVGSNAIQTIINPTPDKTTISLPNVDNVKQLPYSYLDTNVNLGNSDVKVPSQKAVKTYSDTYFIKKVDDITLDGGTF
jgi:hypothetical protein